MLQVRAGSFKAKQRRISKKPKHNTQQTEEVKQLETCKERNRYKVRKDPDCFTKKTSS